MDPQERFTALYQANYGAVLRYACRRTDPDTARDVAADTFLVAWRRLSAVPVEQDHAQPWLYGVARKILANTDRSRQRSERLAQRVFADGAQPRGTADLAEAVAERSRINEALGRLSDGDQETLRLVGWEELDLAAAALALGCSRSAMAVRLHRARRRMARALRVIDSDEQSPADVRAPATNRGELA